MSIYDESEEFHRKLRGKLSITPKVEINDKKALSLAYTPGVAYVSRVIAEDKSKVYDYTSKWNSVAIVSDGSRVLGLGNVGPEAAMPVMEGKAMIFKQFGNVDAYPLCIDVHTSDEIAAVVKAIAPTFGGINLEDISSPKCFEVEDKVADIGIPVFHDDQHGTAIVTLAALINALKVVGKKKEVKVAVLGAGAAGYGIITLLRSYGITDIVATDSKGIIYEGRPSNDYYKSRIAGMTNIRKIKGDVKDAISGTDVVVAVSGIKNLVTQEMIKSMNDKSILFVLTNPEPEISYEDALEAGAEVVGTGRSDLPNQINNSLAFPGVFRGTLDARAKKITPEMKIAAAEAIAALVEHPSAGKIVPSTTDSIVHTKVAEAVKNACKKISKFPIYNLLS